MSSVYKRGATWRRWDLHIHTPYSIIQHYGGPPTFPQFIDALEGLPENVKVAGITDYYFLDGFENVIKAKLKDGKLDNLDKIFPILEFRVDTFGSASQNKLSCINLHIFFDVDEDNIDEEIKLIKEQFIGRINLSSLDKHRTVPLSRENMATEASDKKIQTGFSQYRPSTRQVLELLESDTWKNRTLAFLGYEEWHSLDKGQQEKVTKEWLYDSADAFLSASATDAIEKKQEVLQQFGEKVFFHSLDIHDFDAFANYKCLTWIKADPSFKGLKHALLDAEERVSLSHTPPRVEYEQKNPEYFIDSLRLQSPTTDQGWFDGVEEIHFNKGLVAIIGDKGNGKSALADIIAVGGNSSRQDYSFLRRKQFLDAPACKRFSAVLSLCDGTEHPFELSEPGHDTSKPERVTYLSQQFVNRLCEEVGGAHKLQDEINRVIFAHLPEPKKLRYESLEELIEHRAGAFDSTLGELRAQLQPINARIVELEDRTDDAYRKRIAALRDQRVEAIAKHEAEKPLQPSAKVTAASVELVKKCLTRKSELQERIEAHEATVTKEEYELDHLLRTKEKLLDLTREMTSLVEDLAADPVFIESGIDTTALFTLNVNTQPIDDVCTQKVGSIDNESNRINRAREKIRRIDSIIERQRLGQNEAERLQNDYALELQAWEDKKKELVGSEDVKETLEWFKKELERINNEYASELSQKRRERSDLTDSIVKTLFDKEEAIKDIYSYVQSKAEGYAKALRIDTSDFIEFAARVTIADTFETDLFNWIDHSRLGTFYGKDRAKAQLEMLLPAEGDSDTDTLRAVPKSVLAALRKNLQSETPEGRKIKEQLLGENKSETKIKLYNFLYSFEYVDARFSITYTGKQIARLSPGERGILLLAFYLLMDDNPNPVIVDQPEENVGNLTIARRLVDFIKLARQKRQIFMVTHSATLAIVCDADQIVHCEMDKVHKNSIQYSTGSIEYDDVKHRSIDILEGTKLSFDSRKEVWDLLPDA